MWVKHVEIFATTPTFNHLCPLNRAPKSDCDPLALSYYNTVGIELYHTPQLTLVVIVDYS